MMDVFKLVEDYMNRLFTGIEGMKILLVDHETSGIISLVMSQTKLFEQDVFLVDYLDNRDRQAQKNLTCVCLVRPTSKNIEFLADEISNPKYLKYHLFFTNAVKNNQLERLAESDEYEVVFDFQEIYCDYFPLNKFLFSFNEPSLKLYEGAGCNNSNSYFTRVSEGICSYFYAYKTRPTIRYFHKSQNCTMFAKEINNIFDMNTEYFNANNNSSNESILLILDRKEDPITPLLTQWTYESMIHEFFVIKNGRVKVDTVNVSNEYVMNFEEDSFYEKEMHFPIWKVAEKVQEMVEKYQNLTLRSKTFENIVDMKKFMQEYPEYKRLSQHVQKHVTIVSELMKMSEKANLKLLSEFEQDITSGSGNGNNLDATESVWLKLKNFLKDVQIAHYHKLRLCMIVLCQVGIHSQHPLDRLSSYGFSDDDVSFLKFFYLTKSSKDQRNNLSLNTATTTITESVKTWLNDTFNQQYPTLKNTMITPLTKHIPRVFDLVDQLIRDKLPESTFPHLSQSHFNSTSGKLKEIVIFIVNGATYEEARFIDFLNKFYNPSIKFTLTSNFVHNHRSFINEMYSEWTHSKSSSSSAAAATTTD